MRKGSRKRCNAMPWLGVFRSKGGSRHSCLITSLLFALSLSKNCNPIILEQVCLSECLWPSHSTSREDEDELFHTVYSVNFLLYSTVNEFSYSHANELLAEICLKNKSETVATVHKWAYIDCYQ